jgi:hypothetical protein
MPVAQLRWRIAFLQNQLPAFGRLTVARCEAFQRMLDVDLTVIGALNQLATKTTPPLTTGIDRRDRKGRLDYPAELARSGDSRPPVIVIASGSLTKDELRLAWGLVIHCGEVGRWTAIDNTAVADGHVKHVLRTLIVGAPWSERIQIGPAVFE